MSGSIRRQLEGEVGARDSLEYSATRYTNSGASHELE